MLLVCDVNSEVKKIQTQERKNVCFWGQVSEENTEVQ